MSAEEKVKLQNSASLTGAGMVPHQQLYPDLRDVLPFSGFATGTLILTDESSSPAISGAGSVKLYQGKFVNVQRRLSPGVGGDIVIDIQEAHPSWSALQDVGGSLALGFYNASRFYGTETDTGVTPVSGKIYLDTSDGGRPYVWNGTELVTFCPAITDDFLQEWFIDDDGRADYDATTGTFSLDGHTGITPAIARRILTHRMQLGQTVVLPADIPVNKLLIPDNSNGLYRHLGPVQLPVVLTGCGATTIRLGLDDAYTVGGVVTTAIPVSAGTADNLAVASGYSSPLTRLLGWIEPRGGITWNIPGLTEIWLANLDYDQDFSWCGGLSFDSVRRMVNRKSSATPVTIRLHSTVYKRLTGADGTLSAAQAQQWAEVLTKAPEKQITFISA